jgi:hypothetical protein
MELQRIPESAQPSANFGLQPGPGKHPVPIRRAGRNAQDVSSLIPGQSAKVTQFHELRFDRISLGLTGGGGAIFAVPQLVYGLGVPAREAVGVSLLTVGSTSLVGLVQRAWRGMVEFPTGLLFAIAGMLGAPMGSWLADRIPEAVLLSLFAVLMLVIAVRM